MLEEDKIEHLFQMYHLNTVLNMVSLILYQDRDLERLRRKWLNALTKRQEYLDQQLQKLVSKPGRKSRLHLPPQVSIELTLSGAI